ncbi:Centromere protein J [Fasciola gigantica]|uniref:Centromere protein J n=1 Tax=Fasciola gigantica TaxID=46835 RepID=A0A504YH38_FASGI|nr:Centromere protein J [Fasciola gigantica]
MAYKELGARMSPEGSLLQYTLDSTQNTFKASPVISNEHKPEERNGMLERCSQRPMEGRRPAAFLRRRQGVSAWCSKIRKQGLPVPDPADELRKRRNSSSLVSPSRTSIASSRLKSNSLTTPRTQSVMDGNTSLTKSNTLWCGLKQRRCSTGSLNDDERPKSSDHVADQSPPKQDPSSAPCTVSEQQLPQAMTENVGDESHNDAGDLEEFEFLEEIAENSSFSSLTTSFVAKLGKSRLKDRLKRAEEVLEKVASNDTRSCVDRCEQEGSSHEKMEAQSTSRERHPERSILSVLDKHRLQGAATIHEPEHDALPPSNGNKNSQQENGLKISSEFDDGNSWTCSTSDINEIVDRPNSSSVLDLSVPNVSSLDGTRKPELRGSDSHLRPRRRSSSRSPCLTNNLRRSGDFLGNTRSHRRPLTRPLSATTHLGSPCTHSTRAFDSSYEDELINLADDFMEQLKRDQPSPGRSTAHTQTLLRQWILRLEAEVRRFKTENATLLKLRSERDESIRRLEMEAKRFEEYKAREIRSFTEMKENELRKLKKERRILEDYERALKSMPSKKDREEIDRLKEEVSEKIFTSQLLPFYQTLSTVSQSVSLRTSTTSSGEQKDSRSPSVARRLKQQQQYLSSCRLSGRPLSRLNSTEKFPETTTRQPVALTHSSPPSFDATSVHTDRLGSAITPGFHQVTPSTIGTRESVISGGYFTGDDDGASSGCAHLDVQQSGINLAPEQTTVACKTATGASEPSLLAVQVMSSVSRVHDPDVQNGTLAKVDKPELVEENLPAPHTAASGNVTRTIKHADGSVEETYSNGAVVVTYFNGSVKEIFPDGVTMVVSLFNGDIKRTMPDGRVVSFPIVLTVITF